MINAYFLECKSVKGWKNIGRYLFIYFYDHITQQNVASKAGLFYEDCVSVITFQYFVSGVLLLRRTCKSVSNMAESEFFLEVLVQKFKLKINKSWPKIRF